MFIVKEKVKNGKTFQLVSNILARAKIRIFSQSPHPRDLVQLNSTALKIICIFMENHIFQVSKDVSLLTLAFNDICAN